MMSGAHRHVDGKAIAQSIQNELRARVAHYERKPVLALIVVGDNPVTDQFVASKKRFAEAIGVVCVEHRLPAISSQQEIEDTVRQVQADADGVVVQLPLPPQINTDTVLELLDPKKDVDILASATVQRVHDEKTTMEPPVAGAVRAILETHGVSCRGKKAVVIGRGALVGAPVATYLERAGAMVSVVDTQTPPEEKATLLLGADIIVSGAGVADLVRPEMITSGVVLIDAGTSGATRSIMGDIAHSCDEKASLFSKTPGGVGPLTVAILFKNLLVAYESSVHSI